MHIASGDNGAVHRRNESLSRLPIGWSAADFRSRARPDRSCSTPDSGDTGRGIAPHCLGATFWFDLLNKIVGMRTRSQEVLVAFGKILFCTDVLNGGWRGLDLSVRIYSGLIAT